MAQRRFPSLSGLRVFEVAARRGSFVAAADELRVTHGAISKQVRALELELGAPLFDRRNRGVHLTPRGLWLAARLNTLFGDLGDMLRDFHAMDARTPLTLSCEPTLCLRLLIPAIAALTAETGLDVRVLAAGGPIDFDRDPVDLALRRSDFAIPSGVESCMLAAEWMGPVVAPSQADDDLASLPRLHSATRPDAWSRWAGARDTARDRDIRYEHFYLALQAAEAGQGAAMASIHMVAPDLESGRLVAPAGFATDGTSYIALSRSGACDPRVARLIDWLAARLTETLRRHGLT
jgi:DNA-binding transcriptional LysR family regulator